MAPVSVRIPANAGLRVMRRSLVKRIERLLTSDSSFTTTIPHATPCSGSLIRYSPIDLWAVGLLSAQISKIGLRPGDS